MDLHSQPQVVLYGLLVRYIAYANDPSSQVTNTITTEQQQQSPQMWCESNFPFKKKQPATRILPAMSLSGLVAMVCWSDVLRMPTFLAGNQYNHQHRSTTAVTKGMDQTCFLSKK